MTDPMHETQRAIFDDLLANTVDLLEIARQHGLSLEELSHVASSPAVEDCLREIAKLHDAFAIFAIGQARLYAIEKLKDDDLKEVQRKACVDLIKNTPAQLAPSRNVEAGDGSHQPIDAATRTMLRRALDAIARQPPEDDA